MKHNKMILTAVAVSALALGGCGGGGGSSSPSGVTLNGSWGGIYSTSGSDTSVSVAVDTNNQITSVTSGGANQYIHGNITYLMNSAYTFDLTYDSGGSAGHGGFLTDASATHAGFLNITNGDFGVLQRTPTATPSYSLADLTGTWSGYGIALTSTGSIDTSKYGPASATVDASGYVSNGIGPYGSFTANFSSPTTDGVYDVSYVNTTNGTNGSGKMYMSLDKRFAAGWVCLYGLTPALDVGYYTDCSYYVWNKQ